MPLILVTRVPFWFVSNLWSFYIHLIWYNSHWDSIFCPVRAENINNQLIKQASILINNFVTTSFNIYWVSSHFVRSNWSVPLWISIVLSVNTVFLNFFLALHKIVYFVLFIIKLYEIYYEDIHSLFECSKALFVISRLISLILFSVNKHSFIHIIQHKIVCYLFLFYTCVFVNSDILILEFL